MSTRPATAADLAKDECTIGKAAMILDVSPRTLVRWDESGRLKALRTETNRRYYKKQQILAFAASRG